MTPLESEAQEPEWHFLAVAPADRQEGLTACPSAFPVAGMEHGAYYLPADGTYPAYVPAHLGRVVLCFATEQDAVNAGYTHGPPDLVGGTPTRAPAAYCGRREKKGHPKSDGRASCEMAAEEPDSD